MDAARKHMTVAEFLAWVETQPKGKYELWHGEVVALGSDRAQHGRAKFATGKAFERAIQAAGLTCEAFFRLLASPDQRNDEL